MKNKEIAFGFIQDGKIFLKSWGSYPDREIGTIKDDDESSSVDYFKSKFEELALKIEQLTKTIEDSENKGSYLMKLKHLKASLPNHDGLGDYAQLHEILEKRENELSSIIEKNRHKNTELKKEMITEIKEIIQIVNWRESTEKIHDIKSRWICTGNAVEELQEELEEEFWQIISDFFERKKAFYADKEKLIQNRKDAYQQLVDQAKKLKTLDSKERFFQLKKLKEEWKEIGNIPREEYEGLWKEFAELTRRKPSFSTLKVDLVLNDLEEMFSGKRNYHFKELENIKKNLSRFRPQNQDEYLKRKKSFQLIQLISEKDFVERLASKRFPDLNTLEADKKKGIKVGILNELISRDQSDLAKYEENSANFNSGTEAMKQLVDKKIQQQRNKIQTKELLLKYFQGR